MPDFVTHIQTLIANPEFKGKNTLLKQVQGFKEASKVNPGEGIGLLGRIFDGLPYHDSARKEYLTKRYRQLISDSHYKRIEDEKAGDRIELNAYSQFAVTGFIDELFYDVCKDLLNEKGELKEELVKLLQLNTLEQWKIVEGKKNITRNIIYAYLSDYTSGRFPAEFSQDPDNFKVNPQEKAEKVLAISQLIQKQIVTGPAEANKAFDAKLQSIMMRVSLEQSINKEKIKQPLPKNVLKQLYKFEVIHRNKISAEDFGNICELAKIVLNIRQKYVDSVLLEVAISKEKEEMMDEIEMRMLFLLLQKPTGNYVVRMYENMIQEIAKWEKKIAPGVAGGARLKGFMNEAREALSIKMIKVLDAQFLRDILNLSDILNRYIQEKRIAHDVKHPVVDLHRVIVESLHSQDYRGSPENRAIIRKALTGFLKDNMQRVAGYGIPEVDHFVTKYANAFKEDAKQDNPPTQVAPNPMASVSPKAFKH